MKDFGPDPGSPLFPSPDARAGFGALWEAAQQIQEAASRAGFDWKTRSGILDKLAEELAELRVADQEGSRTALMEELGDILFVLIHYAWWTGIALDQALDATRLKFRKRFDALQDAAAIQGRKLFELSPSELDSLWQEVKRKLAVTPDIQPQNPKSQTGRADD
jgi:uncharacterized protein YabN with tetrapyrrole methylase and pyrophosphatase domain